MKGIYYKFGEYYDLIYDSFYDYKMECDNLENIFKEFSKKPPMKILDIGCGTGSHAMEMAKRGYQLTGIDLSPIMIEEAKRKVQNANMEIDFRLQDMRNLKLDSKFHAAICLFGGFGYLLTAEDLRRFFDSVKEVLLKDSLLIFEFWNKEEVKPKFRSWIKAEDKDKDITIIRLSESNFDEKSNILTLPMEFFIFDRAKLLDSFTETHKLRCFDILEIKKLLENLGFDILATYKKDVKTNVIENDLSNAFNIIAVAILR